MVSVLRTSVYGGVAAVFAIGRAEAAQLLDAVILGAVVADFVTWLARSAVQLPNHLLHGGYDALVYLAFGCFFFRFATFEIGDDGTAVAGAFVAFMLVLGVKVVWYGMQMVRADLEQE
jgi:hypothetical protein